MQTGEGRTGVKVTRRLGYKIILMLSSLLTLNWRSTTGATGAAVGVKTLLQAKV